MYIQELKAIELCLRYIAEKQDLKKLVAEDFEDLDTFEKAKMNIYNFISIYTILSHSNIKKYNFDLEKFLEDGTSSLFSTPLSKSEYIIESSLSPEEIINLIISSISKKNFYFDEFNNVIIENSEIYAALSPEWLRRLSENIKASEFKKIVLFNKNIENNILDEKSLLNYLYHTKTFILTGNANQTTFEEIYNKAILELRSQFSKSKKVKAEDLKNILNKKLSKNSSVQIDKYSIPSYSYVIKKANEKGESFYNLNIEQQKEYISKWLLEMECENNYLLDELRNFILGINRFEGEVLKKEVDFESCFLALVSLYINILIDSKIDLYDISLTKFNIKKYVSPKNIKLYTELKAIIKKINTIKDQSESKNSLSEAINQKMQKINSLRDSEDESLLDKEISILEEMFKEYKDEKATETNLKHRRNTLQNIIQYNQSHSIEDIAFENDTIMDLIKKATFYGRIYFDDYNRNRIKIETFNKEVGMIDFQTVISIQDFLTMIEDINYFLDNNKEEKLIKVA